MQVEHHLFPRIPRHNLRRIRGPIQALCAKHGLVFNIVGLVKANLMLIQSFRDAAKVAAAVDLAKVRVLCWASIVVVGGCMNARADEVGGLGALLRYIMFLHPSSPSSLPVCAGTSCFFILRHCSPSLCLVWWGQVAEEPVEHGHVSDAISVFKQSAMCHGLFAEG